MAKSGVWMMTDVRFSMTCSVAARSVCFAFDLLLLNGRSAVVAIDRKESAPEEILVLKAVACALRGSHRDRGHSIR
jgi:hypothetical protein